MPSARAIRACLHAVRGAVGLTTVLALLSLVAAATGNLHLRSAGQPFPVLVPNASVALLLAAVALASLAEGRRRSVLVVGRACAIASAGIGLATLAEYVSGRDLGIDYLLVRDTLCVGNVPCGRPSLYTAASVVALTGATLAMRASSARSRAIAQVLALAVAVAALIALAGHVHGATVLHGAHDPARGLSIQAGLCLLALSTAVLAATPRDGFMRVVTSSGMGGMIARRFLLAALSAPVIGVVVMTGQRAGLYGYEISVALLAVAALVVGVTLTLVTARTTDEVDLALRASEERHRAFVEQASDGIFVADLEGWITDVNTAGCRMLGHTRDELLGANLVELVSTVDVARFAEHKVSLLSGEVEVGEWTARRKDGSTIPLEVSAKILPDGRWQAIARDITDRKRLENELKKREADLNRAQGVAQTGSWTLDVERNVLLWSDEIHRMFQIPKGTPMTYETFLSRVHPDDREYVSRKWKAATCGEPYDIEHRIALDGEVRWVRERAALERGADGRLIGGVGTVQDITERKAIRTALEQAHAMERELRDRIERVSAASVTVSEAVAALPETGMDAVLRAIAHQARHVTGADYAAIGLGLGADRPFDKWVHDGVPQGVAARVGRRPRAVGILATVARGNTVRVADVHGEPTFGGLPPQHPPLGAFLGTPIRFRGRILGNLYLAKRPGAGEFTQEDATLVEMLAARAGTELRTAQLYERETQERARLETIIDSIPAGVVVVEVDGGTVRNQAMLSLSSETEVTQEPFGPRISVDLRTSDGERLPVDEHPLVRALRTGEETRNRELAARVGGVDVPVLVSGAPIRNAQSGAIVGAVASFQDITALKALERMREEWTSVIAHDLRQPLNAIALLSDLLAQQLARQPLDVSKASNTVEKVKNASGRLERMIRDLTDVSRIEASRLALEPRDAELGPLVREVVARSDAAEREVRVAQRGVPRSVSVDVGRIEQVLGNLLSNAVKYGTPETPIDVTIDWRHDDVEVTVTNRGEGIAPEDRERVFGRFERTTGAQGKKGLGLGLYICHGLVAAHGGEIWVDGAAGVTSFHFTLPVAARRLESGIEDLAPVTEKTGAARAR